MNCSRAENLREYRQTLLFEGFGVGRAPVAPARLEEIERELAKVHAAIMDHENFWHPHGCTVA